MIRLKATILDEKEKLIFRNQNKSNRIRSQRGGKNNEINDIFNGNNNKGIHERNKKDEQNNNNKSDDIIKLSLIAKVNS